MSEPLDILIVGAGLVGASLACALDGRGYRVALAEAALPALGPPGFDERKLALSAASLNALGALGVLPKLATPPTPIRRLHVSRSGDFGAVRLAAADFERDGFGAVVLARELGLALEARLGELSTLARHRPAQVVAVEPQADVMRVRLREGDAERVVDTRLLGAADGTRTFVRSALGIGTAEHDYRQTLFVCSLSAERANDGTAYERFTAQGPVALLPMGRDYGAICAVASDDAARIAAMDAAAYADYYQSRFGWRAGRITRVGTRSQYPLTRVIADRVTGPRTLLMGNAAQTIHPIGAQGFNLGLRDALAFAELLDGGDPGAEALLVAYADVRREDR